MVRATLEIGGLRMVTEDRLTIRTLYRLMASSVPPDELAEVADEPQPPWRRESAS